MSPQKQMLTKKQGKWYGNPHKPESTCSVINLSDEVKFLDLLKGVSL
jgi:hypothetical protein